MSLTVVDLLYPEKLKEEISKKVTFDNSQLTSRTGYVQSMGKGLTNLSISISLQYYKLTATEKTNIESLFRSKTSETVVRFSDRVFTSKLFKLPTSWKVEKVNTIENNVAIFTYDITFTLVSL